MKTQPLTPAQVEQYYSDGYLVVPGVFDGEMLAELRSVTEQITASAKGLTKHTDILDLEDSHTPDSPRVRRIKRPHLAHSFYNELARHESITSTLELLIGPNIRLRPAGKVNMKAADYGSPVEWHQDWAFYPHTNQDVLAVGVLLDDMDHDNGPLMFLPRSHTGPIFDHHSNGSFCGAIDVYSSNLDVSGAIKVHAKAGSITIHHARLIHGSELNTSGRQRRVLLYEYAAADAWPLAGIENVSNMEEFNSRIVHGEPTLQPRLESVPVRMPLPIAKYQGSIYENQRTLESRYFAKFQSSG